MVRCGQLATSFYNFTVTVDDFAALMESVENYRCQTLFICSFMWVSTWHCQVSIVKSKIRVERSLEYFTWPEIYFDWQNEIDIYRLALHQKKVSSLLGNLLKREVVFDEAEKALVESALSQMEKFKEDVTRSLSSQLSTKFLIISLLFLGVFINPQKWWWILCTN